MNSMRVSSSAQASSIAQASSSAQSTLDSQTSLSSESPFDSQTSSGSKVSTDVQPRIWLVQGDIDKAWINNHLGQNACLQVPQQLGDELQAELLDLSMMLVVASKDFSKDMARQQSLHHGIDINPVLASRCWRDFGLIAFDMDSTLITIECIDEIAAAAGCGAEVAAITEAAMRGEISDYDESLRQRVLLLKGQSQHLLDRLITEKLVLNPGVERFARHARTQGLKLIVLSGGFYPIIDAVANMIQADAYRANQLGHDQGRLDGRLVGPIVNAQAKASYLMDFARQWGLNPKQTIAIGDGANDLAMMAMAGLSASWRAKPLVARQADLAFVGQGLDAMLEHFQESRSPALSRALDLVLKTHASA